MPLDFQVASIDLGQGIDTKTENKLVMSSKLTALQNGIFTKAKSITKRNGYDSISKAIIGGGTLTAPRMNATLAGRLVCEDQGSLYEYSESAAAWRNAGKYDSIGVSNTFVSGANQTERSSSVAVLGNYALIAYDNWANVVDYTTPIMAKFSVIDLSTGTFLANDTAITSSAGNVQCVRAVLLGGTQLALTYINSTNGLSVRTITISAGAGVVVGGETNIAPFSDLQSYKSTANQSPFYSYDVVANVSGAVVAWSSSAGTNPIKLVTILTSGSTSASGSIAAAGFAIPLSLTADSTNGKIWIYWGVPTSATAAPGTGMSLKYAVILSGLTSPTAIFTIASSLVNVRQVTSVSVSITSQTCYYTQAKIMTGTGASIPSVVMISVALSVTGTAGSLTPVLTNADIYAKPFTMNGKNYLPVVFYSGVQFSGFLLDLTDNHVAGKFLTGTAEGAFQGIEINTNPGGGGYWWRYPGFISAPVIYSSTMAIFSAGFVLEAINASSLALGTSTQLNISSFLMGTTLVTFDFNHADARQAIDANGVLALNGSIVSAYDGGSVVELGFNYYPEIDYITGVGGHLVDGTYQYQAIYQWSDAQGNLYQSSPSPTLSVAISGGGGVVSVAVYVKALSFSAKNSAAFNPQVILYRTDSLGSIPYYCTEKVDVNSSDYNTTGFVTLTDFGATTLQNNPIYTSGTAIIPNDATPSAMVMWVNNDRLWLIDSENADINVFYSKTFALRGGVNFSGLLTFVTDARFGDIVAGCGMDEKTVLLKQHGILYFIGDGANDSGSGATFNSAQLVPNDAGCANSRGIILMPDGIIFKASDNKGIYKLSRGLQVSYFGFEVENYNSQDITSSLIIPDRTQIRFLTSSGVSLLYDYFMNQWSTFTNHTGYSATLYRGKYVYARTDGLIFKENATTFLDNATAYALSATTAWIKASGPQNFERIRLVSMLGAATGFAGHGIQVLPVYNFDSTTQLLTSAYSFTSLNYQYRAWLPLQKCDSIQFIINEITTGVSGESITFTDLGIEIGLKKGLHKLPANRTVG